MNPLNHDIEKQLEEFQEHAHQVLRIAGYTWSVVDGERWYLDFENNIELRGVLEAYAYHQRKVMLQEIVKWYQNLLPIIVDQAIGCQDFVNEFIRLDPQSFDVNWSPLPLIYNIPREKLEELGRILGVHHDKTK